MRSELLGRIAVVVARTAARAVKKRGAQRPGRRQPWSGAVARALAEDEPNNRDEGAEMFF